MTTFMLILFFAACGGSDSGGGPAGDLATPVGQGGAQDFGAFRDILDAGGIPGPETLDDVGFFAEHVIGTPPADCGEDVCVHARLGTMGNMISGADCTIVLLGFSSPLDPATLERPPLDLAIAVDVSGSMEGDGIASVRSGLRQMLPYLAPEDRLSLVAFDDRAQVVAEALAPTDPALLAAIDALEASGGTDLYDGLRVALDDVLLRASPDRQRRVMLISDGAPTSGIMSHAHILDLAAAYSAEGLGLTTIALGDADVALLRDLAIQGGGSAYFLDDAAAIEEVFVEEAQAFLWPLAEDATVGIDLLPGWDGRAMYGTSAWTGGGDRFDLEIPVLQLAHRTSADDDALGRRGGGGAIVVEVLPGDSAQLGEIGEVRFDWRVPGTEERRSQRVAVEQPVRPGDDWFTDPASEKAFVTLNIYVGFEMAAQAAADQRPNTALQVLDGLRLGVGDWLVTNPDADIADDLVYIERFVENLLAAGAEESDAVQVPEPWPAD